MKARPPARFATGFAPLPLRPRPRHACDNWPDCDCCGGLCEIERILRRQKVGKVDWLLLFCLVALALFGVMALADLLPAEWLR